MLIKEFIKLWEPFAFSHLCTPGQFQETGITVLIFSCLLMRPPLVRPSKTGFSPLSYCHNSTSEGECNQSSGFSTWVLFSHMLVAMPNGGPATFALATSDVQIKERWCWGNQHQRSIPNSRLWARLKHWNDPTGLKPRLKNFPFPLSSLSKEAHVAHAV